MTRGDISDFAPGTFLFYLVPHPCRQPLGHEEEDENDGKAKE